MSNSEPTFAQTGGSVFGLPSLVWRTLFGAKVDQSGGYSINQTLTTPTINGLPIPTNIVTSATAPLSISAGDMSLLLASVFAVVGGNLDLANESANMVLAGPTSGGAAKPTFRALVSGDIPGGATASPTGAMTAFASATPPSGWLNCDSSAVSRTTYAALFAVIGTTFGVGDGSTTFNLPDMRGRVAAGYDPGNATGRLTGSPTGGVSAAALANAGGEQGHANTTAETATHTHTITDPGHAHVQDSQTVTQQGAGSIAYLDDSVQTFAVAVAANSTGGSTTGVTVNNAGSGSAHNNVQPSLIINWIIKT